MTSRSNPSDGSTCRCVIIAASALVSAVFATKALLDRLRTPTGLLPPF